MEQYKQEFIDFPHGSLNDLPKSPENAVSKPLTGILKQSREVS